ncbi:guanitoxin biosynthesis MBL fold metallo-hydrolase GntH [Rhizobium ruizarguesonis]
MEPEDETRAPTFSRREMLKAVGPAAAGVAAGSLVSPATAEAQQTSCPDEANAYGAPPGSGVSLPPTYLPTPSIKNRNNYFPQSEPLGEDEMRITFMGSQPFPPRMDQAGTCIMVELGNGKRLFFDFGSGCMRNIIANQVPIPEINDIFITHLHLDHYADVPYLWAFAPFAARFKPLRIIGPSGRTPELGTRAMCENLRKMGRWHMQAFSGTGPIESGFEIEVTEFDFRDDGGVCYDKDGVKVTHWRRSHAMDGASAYRLDWNGLSFVWTGDGKPDELTAKYAKGCDVFVTEMAVDMVNLWALKQGVPPLFGALTIDIHHTPHYGFGYLANLVQPRLAMASHVSFDKELIGEMTAGVRMHYKGQFAFGIDHTVVNVTKDRLWIREAALPAASNSARPNPQWMLKEQFGGEVPPAFPPLTYTVAGNQEQAIRDLEIKPEAYTPKDQLREEVREWPAGMTPAQLMSAFAPK